MSLSAHAAAGMILGGVGGLSPDAPDGELVDMLAGYADAGIKSFLLSGNLARNSERLSSLVQTARLTAQNAGLGRALIAIGGDASPGFGLPFFPEVPTPLGIASLKSIHAAKRTGYYVGSRLAACGIDMVLGPRLDLASDPKDPAGAFEGFGEDSRVAGLLGAAYARGLRARASEHASAASPGSAPFATTAMRVWLSSRCLSNVSSAARCVPSREPRQRASRRCSWEEFSCRRSKANASPLP